MERHKFFSFFCVKWFKKKSSASVGHVGGEKKVLSWIRDIRKVIESGVICAVFGELGSQRCWTVPLPHVSVCRTLPFVVSRFSLHGIGKEAGMN